jgi:hypothetical protein
MAFGGEGVGDGVGSGTGTPDIPGKGQEGVDSDPDSDPGTQRDRCPIQPSISIGGWVRIGIRTVRWRRRGGMGNEGQERESEGDLDRAGPDRSEMDRAEMGAPDPDPPRLREFMERSAGRLLMEAILGGSAGALLAVALGQEPLRGTFMMAGALAAPMALMLTPVRGAPAYRGIRYGLALSVLLTLAVSLTGPGRERPVDELILFAFLFFALGSLGHGVMAATVDREVDDEGG